MNPFHIPDGPNPHKIINLGMVETRVADKDLPSALITLPLYRCENCGWEGFAPAAYGCSDPDISELTDILK